MDNHIIAVLYVAGIIGASITVYESCRKRGESRGRATTVAAILGLFWPIYMASLLRNIYRKR